MRLFLLCTLATLLFGTSTPISAAAPDKAGDATHKADQELAPELVAALKNGGHIIYFRHAATDHDTVDQQVSDLADCSTQRNLSQLGRQQSIAIGEAFRALEIPVGTVLSSPFCRCVDTAKLAFGTVQTSTDLVFALGRGAAETTRLGSALKTLLTKPPAPGTNTIIAGHTVNLREATQIWPKPEGAAVIIKPDGRGGYEYVDAIHPNSWKKTIDSR